MSTHKVCITCGEEKTIFEFPSNKNSRDGLLNTCKECQRAKCLAYYRAHREERCAKHREWARKNKEHCNEYQKAVKHRYRKRVNSYMQRRRAEEPIWYYSTRLFYPIRYVLNKRGNCVSRRAEEITGLPADKLFEYLTKTWRDRYGTGWNGEKCDIDHITPRSTAKTKEEVDELFNYKNLRLLRPHDNRSK